MVEAITLISPVVVTAVRTLERALVAYRSDPTNPERLWDFQTAHWGFNRLPMGLSKADVVVADCPYSKDEMRKFMGVSRFSRTTNPDFALFLPEVASTAEGLVILGKSYPAMTSTVFQDGTPVKNVDTNGNEVSLYGWMRTESGIDAPYTSTDEDQAREIVRKNGRTNQTLNVYVEAGQQSKLVSPNSQYLDEISTGVRVLSSRVDGQVVRAYFHPGGYCLVDWYLGPEVVYPFLGVRSVGV